MKLPISNRLKCCAGLVPPGSRVYDVGCDHGYLGIYLLREGLATHVFSSDLRPGPLQRARENALLYGVQEQMSFQLCDGLAAYDGTEGSVIVIAGMGGDAIANILDACPWVQSPSYTLVLQPQTSGNDLRRYLGRVGWNARQEVLVRDKGFVYTAMVCTFGGGVPVSPGREYVPEALLSQPGDLLEAYFTHVLHGLNVAVDGLRRSTQPQDQPRLAYYETALREVLEMKAQYDHSTERI